MAWALEDRYLMTSSCRFDAMCAVKSANTYCFKVKQDVCLWNSNTLEHNAIQCLTILIFFLYMFKSRSNSRSHILVFL